MARTRGLCPKKREEAFVLFRIMRPPRNSVISFLVYAKEKVCDTQDFMNKGLLPKATEKMALVHLPIILSVRKPLKR